MSNSQPTGVRQGTETTIFKAIVSASKWIGQDKRGFFYDYPVRITFNELNIEGNVSHDKYASLFGKARELFGLECIPGFAKEIGRVYLLKTRNAIYNYKKDFHFGDKMIVRMRVLRRRMASFILRAEYINAETGEIYATGEQTIVYTDIQGNIKKMPESLRSLLDFLSSPA